MILAKPREGGAEGGGGGGGAASAAGGAVDDRRVSVAAEGARGVPRRRQAARTGRASCRRRSRSCRARELGGGALRDAARGVDAGGDARGDAALRVEHEAQAGAALLLRSATGGPGRHRGAAAQLPLVLPKALPAAFFKGVLPPLAEARATLREALIVGSVLSKVSVRLRDASRPGAAPRARSAPQRSHLPPPSAGADAHSAVAILKLEMEYSGASALHAVLQEVRAALPRRRRPRRLLHRLPRRAARRPR